MNNLVLVGLTVFLNISITLFILLRYTVNLTKEINKIINGILEVMNLTTDATFEVRNQIFEEFNKRK